MHSRLTFKLHVGREEAMRYYRGEAQAVVVHADNGQRLRFPAMHLRRFIEQDGIHGHFAIQFDANHKLQDLQRLAD